MSIIERKICLEKLHDGKEEKICISLGYHDLQFQYEDSSTYTNTSLNDKIS